ncbi:hypothetical protein H4P12_07315 [Paracoccus sp. 11-3]|uniref:Secreted protein n=1 Tax=Paracoccus amoyensis TaxID=2760093 RepID=A0A926G652_9RHOB|nr:VPLPA-CTERM sorting domain-containing protein [Paracoccus amoyensis]MBC9246523.1 hypothetical protein [Paracoccus amoyensis]
MYLCKLTAIAALSLCATQAVAATYTFNVQVVESIDTPENGFVLPAVGTIGTISFLLDATALDADGDPTTGVGLPTPLNPAYAGASAAIGGLTASLDSSSTTIFGFDQRARFSNGDFSSISVSLPAGDCVSLGCTFAGNFSVYGPPGSGTPASFADVDAFLNNPLSTVMFSFNGTATGQYASFRAESVSLAPIPLPASGILLIGALTGAAMLRKKRRIT